MEQRYTNRELDHYMNDIKASLLRIESQTIKTNGRVTKLEKIILIVSVAVSVLLITNGSSFVDFALALVT